MDHILIIGILITVLHSTYTDENLVCKYGNGAHDKTCSDGYSFCGSIKCKTDKPKVCIAVFTKKEDEPMGKLKIGLNDCWDADQNDQKCYKERCVLKQNEVKKTVYTCCCYGNFCNSNVIFPESASVNSTSLMDSNFKGKDQMKANYYLYYVLASIILSTMMIGAALYFWVKRKRRRLDNESLLSDVSSTTKPMTLPAVMMQVIHEGQTSVIWKGSYCQQDVAIKVIDKHNYNLWSAEQNLFVNFNLKHENIVKFVCAEKRYHESSIQYWIITEFHHNGSLADYLYVYALSKNTFLKMLYSIVRGLVYLHSNDAKNGKPMIAHRDLKPGNVLVKPDLSCCISDLGLAIALPEHVKVPQNLCQAGTKRYMAPEILQGAVAFHQESFLRADMYSMGLLMWELFSRTKLDDEMDDLQPYQPPYAEFVNFNPSVDEMLKCVVENKERPHINPSWNQTPVFSNLVKTMEGCWDDDNDARLTSHCVEQRLLDLINSPPDCSNFEQEKLLKDSSEDESVTSCTDLQTVLIH